MTGGSDSPATKIDPHSGISVAANPPHPDERLSAMEAIKMFTIDGAKSALT